MIQNNSFLNIKNLVFIKKGFKGFKFINKERFYYQGFGL